MLRNAFIAICLVFVLAGASFGTVTDADIIGPIGAEKIAAYAGVKIVHKGLSDGVNTFNTVLSAINYIGHQSTKYAIIVMPGDYSEDFTALSGYYNIDIIGYSRRSYISSIGQTYKSYSTRVFPIPSGVQLKNLSLYGQFIFDSPYSSIVDCDISNGGSNGIIVTNLATTDIKIENVTINNTDYGITLWAGNININNVKINTTYSGTGIKVNNGLTNIKLNNISISGMYGLILYGTVELTNSRIDCTSRDIVVDYSGNVTVNNSQLLNTAGTAYVMSSANLKINNSVIDANIAGYSGSFKVGASKISGTIMASGLTKIVNSYDGNYDPIPNGTY